MVSFWCFEAIVIVMTRLYILIIFDIKKIPRSIWNSSTHFRKKSKEPSRYLVVRQKYVIHPQNLWTSQNFLESNASALVGISPSAGNTPCHFFFINFFLAKNAFMFFFFCICASIRIGWKTRCLPYAGFFKFFILDGGWSYFIGMFQLTKQL